MATSLRRVHRYRTSVVQRVPDLGGEHVDASTSNTCGGSGQFRIMEMTSRKERRSTKYHHEQRDELIVARLLAIVH